MATKPTDPFLEWDSTVQSKVPFDTALANTGFPPNEVIEYDNLNDKFNTDGQWFGYLEEVTDENVITLDKMRVGRSDKTWDIATVPEYEAMVLEISAILSVDDWFRLDAAWQINLNANTLAITTGQGLNFFNVTGAGSITINGYGNQGTTGFQTHISSATDRAGFTFDRVTLGGGIAISDVWLDSGSLEPLTFRECQGTDIQVNASRFDNSSDRASIEVRECRMVNFDQLEVASQETTLTSGAVVVRNSGLTVSTGSISTPGNGLFCAIGSSVSFDTVSVSAGTGPYFDFVIDGGTVLKGVAGTWTQYINSF